MSPIFFDSKEVRSSDERENDHLVSLKKLIEKAKNTSFGIDHSFNQIKNHEDFIKRVPVRDYEQIKKYITRIFRRVNCNLGK